MLLTTELSSGAAHHGFATPAAAGGEDPHKDHHQQPAEVTKRREAQPKNWLGLSTLIVRTSTDHLIIFSILPRSGTFANALQMG
jgi:hypothetical protein